MMDLSFSKLIEIITRRITAIIICALVGLGISFTVTQFFIKPTYTSSVSLYAMTTATNMTPQTQHIYTVQAVKTCVNLLDMKPFYREIEASTAEEISKYTDETFSASRIKSMVAYEIASETEVFKVYVNAPDKNVAKIIADAIGNAAPSRIEQITSTSKSATESALDSDGSNAAKVYSSIDVSLYLAEDASLPSRPSSPNLLSNVALGTLLGAVLSALFCIAMEFFNTHIKSELDLKERYDIPILGTIPDFSGGYKE